MKQDRHLKRSGVEIFRFQNTRFRNAEDFKIGARTNGENYNLMFTVGHAINDANTRLFEF